MVHKLRPLFTLILVVVSSSLVFAGGVKGIIKGNDGEPLSFTTIFIKELGTGTTSNAQGFYQIALTPGTYTLTFQYLGHETQEKQLTVESDFIELNITLTVQPTELRSVIVSAGNEDPAYTIMRKAISKAAYHLQQLDSYSAQVYMKGSGRLVDYPWLAKKMIEKEGIKKNQAFVVESVSEIKYTRPNKFEERVISIRTDGTFKD